ncbi:MAG: protein phosphatase 2C domain-containing protein [Nocardioidaceae bacterium]
MALSLHYGAVSDVGSVRRKNDDSGYAGPYFLMVADGMGGAPAGDLASAVAVQAMQRLDAPPPDNLLEALSSALHRANDRLAEMIDEDPAVEGMGTTVTAVLFDGHRVGVCHLGDSRGYLWRDGELLRVTHDHTWVQNLIDEGRITEEQAKVHSHRSLILKVLDGRHDNEPDLTLYDVLPGDRILLCSDGLSGFVSSERMERVLSVGATEEVAQELLQLALEAASTDNVTVVVGDVVEGAGPTDTAEGLTLEPLVVGAAADHPRRPFSRLRTWAHGSDTHLGESLLDPDIDPEELRYAPREPRRFRWLARGGIALVGLAVLVALGVVSYNWTQRQYFVAAADDQVAIYQGLQPDLPGMSLHHVQETPGMTLSELPSYYRSQVIEGMTADNLADAHRIVEQLQTFADGCAAQAVAKLDDPSTQSTPPNDDAPPPSTGPTPEPRRGPSTPGTTAPRSPSAAAPSTSGSVELPPDGCSGATPAATSAGSSSPGTR